MSKVTIRYKAMMTKTAGFLRTAEIGDYLDDEDTRIKGFKMIDVLVGDRSITEYVKTCDKVKADFVDLHVGVQTFIDKLNQGAHIAPFQVEILNHLRQAMVDAICKADQEGYERAVADQQEAIENASHYATGGYVKCGRIDNGEISGVVGKAYILPSARYSGKSEAELRDEILKAQAEVAAESCLKIIDDSPIEPEQRARYIAKQMINAALDEHMAKIAGGE